jgi:hypothetical protein
LPVTAVLAAPFDPGLAWFHGILRIAHLTVTPCADRQPLQRGVDSLSRPEFRSYVGKLAAKVGEISDYLSP